MSDKIAIEWIPVTDLHGYEGNPRNNEPAIEPVKKSIEAFGFKVPLQIDDDNVIINGHTRLAAAIALGMEKVPCVRCSDLTPEQARAFRLIDNKTSELALWDAEKLDEELRALRELNISMDDFGFDKIEDIDPSYYQTDSVKGDDEEPEPKTAVCPHCGRTVEL